MKRKASSDKQGTSKRHAAVMSLSDGSVEVETKQYAIMEYDRRADLCMVTYAPKRPIRTAAQRRKGRAFAILGPQTMDELRITMQIVLRNMQSPPWSGSDSESEQEGDESADSEKS